MSPTPLSSIGPEGAYPNLAYQIVYPEDISMAPWLKFPVAPVCKGGGVNSGPNENPKIGWMTAALAVDPFNTNNFLYVSGATYTTVFLAGEVGTVLGYYASTDGGNTWTQINDSNHNWYYSGYVIAGDPNRVGRVYIATNGRGIIYGDGTP